MHRHLAGTPGSGDPGTPKKLLSTSPVLLSSKAPQPGHGPRTSKPTLHVGIRSLPPPGRTSIRLSTLWSHLTALTRLVLGPPPGPHQGSARAVRRHTTAQVRSLLERPAGHLEPNAAPGQAAKPVHIQGPGGP
ncbi:hypothetical protein NDU88_009468 [Pleurodeles waltl]|uniref:Uncharacterized protein n=1 Tax=Pleurodeles waltl TaxID=8319 RepID=A0AAV7PVW9_PLEWA|nr:hypothetical protein NDU88_009468 [Pleurodeles waltl]